MRPNRHYHLLHNKDYFNEIVDTCLSNWNYQDNALGYTFYELKQRITNDVCQIQYKDLHNTAYDFPLFLSVKIMEFDLLTLGLLTIGLNILTSLSLLLFHRRAGSNIRAILYFVLFFILNISTQTPLYYAHQQFISGSLV